MCRNSEAITAWKMARKSEVITACLKRRIMLSNYRQHLYGIYNLKGSCAIRSEQSIFELLIIVVFFNMRLTHYRLYWATYPNTLGSLTTHLVNIINPCQLTYEWGKRNHKKLQLDKLIPPCLFKSWFQVLDYSF